MPYATVLTLLGAIKFPWIALGFSTFYLLGAYKVAREYIKKGANTGGKCLGRAIAKYSLIALTGLAIVSSVVLIRQHKSLEKVCDLWHKYIKK